MKNPSRRKRIKAPEGWIILDVGMCLKRNDRLLGWFGDSMKTESTGKTIESDNDYGFKYAYIRRIKVEKNVDSNTTSC